MEACLSKWRDRLKQPPMSVEEIEALRLAGIREDEEKRRLDRMQRLLQKVPVRFREKTFADYQVTCPEQGKVKAIAERFAATCKDRLHQGAGMQFLGMPGTGKTLLSLILYQHLVRAGYQVHYESSLQFLRNLQEKRYESYAAFQNSLAHYRDSHLLILDEVAESVSKDGLPSAYERQLLFSLVDARYQEKLSTLVISNRPQHELITRLGSPIMDRLFENGVTLIFNWNSYRQTGPIQTIYKEQKQLCQQ